MDGNGSGDSHDEFEDADQSLIAETMSEVECPEADCTGGTGGAKWSFKGGDAVAATMLAHHLKSHEPAERAPSRGPRPPPLQMPKLSSQCSVAKFDDFQKQWRFYKASVDMPQSAVTSYLMNCLEEEVKNDVLAADADIHEKTEVEVLAAIKQYAVQRRAISSLKVDVWQMSQGEGESVHKFYARVKELASQCQFTVACTNNTCPNRNAPYISYCDEIIKQVILNGLADHDIKKEVLGTAGVDTKSLMDTLGLIENKETAARSVGTRTVAGAATTSYKKIQANDKRLNSQANCDKCQKKFNNKRIRSRKNKDDEITTYTTCLECWKKEKPLSRRKNREKTGHRANTDEDAATEVESNAMQATAGSFSFFGASVQSAAAASTCKGGPAELTRKYSRKSHRGRRRYEEPMKMSATTETIPAMSYDSRRGWVTRREDHGRVKLSVYTVREDAETFKIAFRYVKPTNILAVADSGCQACLTGPNVLYKLGLKKSDLCRIKSQSISINGTNLNVIGAFILRMAGTDPVSGKTVETAAQVRVAEGVKDLFISKEVMRALGILDENFPSIVAAGSTESPSFSSECGNSVDLQRRAGGVDALIKTTCPGGCRPRTPPPPLPDRLPFEPVEENVPKMKAYLLDRYKSSTFNKCGHQRLPMMSCKPLRIHIDPEAEPKPDWGARPVPVHLREKVKQQLDEDERLGVIEKVPIGTPTTWQARMHVVTKPNGEPRRTVDFRKLNKHCKREDEHVVSPFKQARLIPASVYKTKTDAWNGYHSCPLAVEDRDYTTFNTEWGRYRYRVAPQGFVASGDAYNQRFSRVLDRVENKTRCVDDVALWDKDIEQHWWRIIRYLDLVAKNGIILSPEKFEFCAHQIDFAGFRVTDTSVKPLPKYLDAIRNFPKPTNISDIRSWFGLVNQVSSYNQLTSLMEPFRKFLSPKVRFYWDDELDGIFEVSKKAIVESIMQGVEIFDPERRTAISTDYSTAGLGYFMYQKYCDCESTVTTCCPTGWRVTLAGSRFLHQAEERYWPTEGELLAVAWALHDTRFFTMGCRDLHIQTDHRALVKLLGDKNLDEMDNRRLINLKEKTMPWNFQISWVPGSAIPAPDATSRKPQESPTTGDDFTIAMAAMRTHEVADNDLAGDREFAAYGQLRAGEVAAVTWERVQEETWRDDNMRQLIAAIGTGFNEETMEQLPANLADFWRHRKSLSVLDEVVMMGERIVIPPSLRQEILDHLHGAHQGVRAMTSRAQASVFWPGISSDIAKRRQICRTCDEIAPSQPQTDAVPPEIPTYPFQMVASDYFDLGGVHYLVTVDRFTNWVDVRRAKPDTEESGSKGLITACREVFMSFGVPEEVANDGGPEYKSNDFKQFLKRWGVRLRTSSAYHPSANGRAEVAVKTAKRALRDHMGQDGRLNSDEFARALLLLRNTPDKATGRSPAELLLGRRLRDALPQPYARDQPLISDDSPVDRRWLDMWGEREAVMRRRMGEMADAINAKAHDLVPLQIGDCVRVQNQTGPLKTRWTRTGVIVEMNLPYDQYLVKMDGSRRITPRNRRFLRKIRATDHVYARADQATRPAGDAPQRDDGPAEVAPRLANPPETPDAQPRGTPAVPTTPPATRWAETATTPPRPVIRTPDRTPATRRATGAIRRHVTFAEDQPQAAPPSGRGSNVDSQVRAGVVDGANLSPHGPSSQAQPAQPATAEPPPQAEDRPGPPAGPEAGARRSTRARTTPRYLRDYVTDEMSVTEIRRMPQEDLEDNGVGGMLDDDIYEQTGVATRHANRASSRQTGCQLPATTARGSTDAAIAKTVLHAVWDELHLRGVGTDKTAEILAEVTLALLDY